MTPDQSDVGATSSQPQTSVLLLAVHKHLPFAKYSASQKHLVILDLEGITIAEMSRDSFDIRLKSPPHTTHEEL